MPPETPAKFIPKFMKFDKPDEVGPIDQLVSLLETETGMNVTRKNAVLYAVKATLELKGKDNE